jgi:hypothetical protein
LRTNFLQKIDLLFRVWRKKTISSYSIKKDKILYYENKIYDFDEQNSNGSLNDVITIVNPPIAVSIEF